MEIKNKIRVIILDDHQSIIDGYRYRLSQVPEVEIVATLSYGDELAAALKANPVDVLILDVQVPTSSGNLNFYPILHVIPRLLQQYPELMILVISMHSEPSLIRAIVDAGAAGYLLKGDSKRVQELGKWILALVNGELCYSEKALEALVSKRDEPFTPRQLEALSLCAAYPNSKTAELARKMEIANSTLRNLLSAVYVKLGVQTRAAAIAKARDLGIITPDSTVPQL
jgi:DNA-binding NarL/FixJ family response regulator